jgi:hypothetical protein
MKVIAEFTVTLAKRRKIEDIIKASRYDEVNFLITEGVKKKRLSLRDEEVGKRTIILIGSDEKVSSNDVLSEAKQLGLLRPDYGDAFLAGEQYSDEQIARPIVFLHDPQYVWSGHSFNLVLDVSREGRIISFMSSGGWWHSKFCFAFRKKR